jgi:DNA-binding XRE family transcriptional regulator
LRNLRKIRIKKKITREELAVKAEVSYGSIVAYENRVKVPSVTIASRIAKVLDVTVEDLTG